MVLEVIPAVPSPLVSGEGVFDLAADDDSESPTVPRKGVSGLRPRFPAREWGGRKGVMLCVVTTTSHSDVMSVQAKLLFIFELPINGSK